MPVQGRRRARGAFTLVELLISLTIASFVLMSVASLIGLSTKAIPAEGGVQDTSLDAGALFALLAADAAVAQRVTKHASNAVTFVTPDQTGDAVADSVRYAWTGVAGGPLARVVNGTDSAELLPAVQSLGFTYTFDDVPAFAELSKVTDARSTFQSSLISVATSHNISTTTWYGQVFAPTLPADAIAWSLEELTLSLGPRGLLTPATTVVVQIRGCDASDKPSSAVYAQATISESSLGLLGLLPATKTFSFSGITAPATEKLCVVVRCSGGDGTAVVGTALGLAWPAGAPAVTSTDSGATWTGGTGVIVGHTVSGSVTRLIGGTSTRHIVSRFSVALEAGESGLAMECAVGARNPAEAAP